MDICELVVGTVVEPIGEVGTLAFYYFVVCPHFCPCILGLILCLYLEIFPESKLLFQTVYFEGFPRSRRREFVWLNHIL